VPENILAGLKLFATVPAAELDVLYASLRPCQMPAGTVLFYEDECGDHFYVVVRGRVEVVKALGTPDERWLGVRGPGDFLGEMSLLNRDGRRTASVRVVEDAELLEMRRADFDALLHRYPLLAYEMVRVLSDRLTTAQNLIISDLREKNQQLQTAYDALQAAQAQIIEKERLDRELQLAHEIQMGLLPHVWPEVPGYDFGAQMVPARAVGGDLYDGAILDSSTVGLLIGDVADKGLPAALFMAQALALLRAEVSRGGSPVEVLRWVNGRLLSMNQLDIFVTALYARLDLPSGELHYARAGHELPLLALSNGFIWSPPQSRGQPLAVFEDLSLDEGRLTLPPGGTLLFYSDGVTDACSPAGDGFGRGRLAEALRAEVALGGSAQSLCDRLLARIMAFQGLAPQHDDITLFVVRRA
jgi:sigma-B regulation protein RsbU (phosphoserine phosphatase)